MRISWKGFPVAKTVLYITLGLSIAAIVLLGSQ